MINKNKTYFKSNNRGSTMVEVLVGFTILVMVLVECMVHIVGVSSDMVEKSVDMQNAQTILTREMYQKDIAYEDISNVTFTLSINKDKTNVNANRAKEVSIPLNADLKKYHSEKADLSVFKILFNDN
ncbi:MAG: hypothetical protein IJV15_02310 [Lachnospiraceae bacterium]|nr:hypothetical protein [Lachnospiraceae bacterium]